MRTFAYIAAVAGSLIVLNQSSAQAHHGQSSFGLQINGQRMSLGIGTTQRGFVQPPFVQETRLRPAQPPRPACDRAPYKARYPQPWQVRPYPMAWQWQNYPYPARPYPYGPAHPFYRR